MTAYVMPATIVQSLLMAADSNSSRMGFDRGEGIPAS
jgi:hypothetical protein